ncbi:CheB methylesterase domain-containing protein [Yoonia sp. BS5-3]|uniref:protein-glutamate methylesterase n=1 Tax=Yoonia phaeophyticola TaxID=3137369 RepID=A0ABZ2V2I3_9RHOB
MPTAKIVIATPYAEDLRRVQQMLRKAGGLRIVAHVPGLMELFNKVEHDPPNMVLIAEDLCGSADFELIVTLFRALDVRWMKFGSVNRSSFNGQIGLQESKAGLFPVALDGKEDLFLAQLRSVLLARQNASLPTVSKRPAAARCYKRMILIGSSTGGVDALKTVLSDFDIDCPPTVVVQHTSQGFGRGLVAVLNRSCAADVCAYTPQMPLERGTVHVIAGVDHHAVFTDRGKSNLEPNYDPPMSGHRPSVDKLFLSAVPYAREVVAVVLTGMGQDGAQGLLALRNGGARTVAQDQESSVVYGMPGAAWSMGAAMRQLPLKDIGSGLLAEAER